MSFGGLFLAGSALVERRGCILEAVGISQNFWETRVRCNPYTWVSVSFLYFNATGESMYIFSLLMACRLLSCGDKSQGC